MANGPLALLDARLVSRPHWARNVSLQLWGAVWGMKEQSMATLAVLTWFEMILHLSGFPLYF